MLVFLVNNSNGVHQVFQAGATPDDAMDHLRGYNEVDNNQRQGSRTATEICPGTSLEFQGYDILGLTNDVQGDLNAALQVLQGQGGDHQKKSRFITAINTVLGKRIEYGTVTIDLKALYKTFLDEYLYV